MLSSLLRVITDKLTYRYWTIIKAIRQYNMAPLDVKLTPAPILPSSSNSTTSTITQWQSPIERICTVLKPLGILFLIAVLGTTWVLARSKEAQLFMKFFEFDNDEHSRRASTLIYEMVAFTISLITATLHVDEMCKTLVGSPNSGKFFWPV